MSCRTRRSVGGFTLVELLVVIGIIALLISMLLPTLNRAREAARRVKCLSNMRQIVMAMNLFAQDNRGLMPGQGTKVWYRFKPSSPQTMEKFTTPNNKTAALSLVNWVCWQRVQDPVTGNQTTADANSTSDQNITESAVAKYLGAKLTQHADPSAANRVSPQLESLFRCPSDKLFGRYSDTLGATELNYRYSYSANKLYLNPVTSFDTTEVPNPPGNIAQRSDGLFNGRLSSIHNTSDKIMLICEDGLNLEDGSWNPAPYRSPFAHPTKAYATRLLSMYHDISTASTAKRVGGDNSVGTTVNSRGNVVMVDGHGEFLSRIESLKQVHTGNPYADPTGF